jgi:4-amino-4-deoxy-L-arabinose transferase-like glycosyltransferase
LTGSKKMLVAVILGVCFLMFFRGIGDIEFDDKQEARDALVIWKIITQVIGYLPLRNEDEIPAKPPFYHWLGPLLSSMTGRVNELTARLTSAI